MIGLGLYAQANNVNLANNITTLTELFVLLQQQREIEIAGAEISRLNAAVFGYPVDFINPTIVPQAAPYPYAHHHQCRCF
jgi:hypothetical protein